MSVRLPTTLLFSPFPRTAAALPALCAAALVSAVLSPAAVAGPPCLGDGCDVQSKCGHPVGCDCASKYRCRVSVDSEPVEKECNLIETEVICVPPICSSPFDCLRDLVRGKKRACRGCGAEGCVDAGCDGGCSAARGCAPRKSDCWLSRLTNGGCSGPRCVNVLDVHEYECGRQCTYEWTAVPANGCGRGGACTTACGTTAPAYPAAAYPAPGPREELPPPAPAPAAHDLPSLDAAAAE